MQEYALDLVLVREARSQGRRDEEFVKLAILSADPLRYLPMLYPQTITKTGDVTTEELEDSETPTEWKFTEHVDPAEAESLLAELMAEGGGSMDMNDLSEFEQDPDW